MTHVSRAEAIATGLVGSSSQVAETTRGRFEGGRAHGTRFVDLHPSGGLHLRILPDRGFDIGPAWYRGEQIAWLSKVGVTAPLDQPTGMSWRDRFGGGLVTTCGLDNVGAPSDGIGLHGSVSHLRADDVTLERTEVGDEVQLVARATLSDVTSLGRHLELERTITTRTGRPTVTVVDIVTNLGRAVEPAPVLYHVNLGFPLWQPGARLEIDSHRVRARDDIGQESARDGSWATAPVAAPNATELVYEHHDPVAGVAAVVNPDLGLRVEISWQLAELSRLYQWTHPAEQVYALGIEPSNASVLGRADDRAAGTLAIIEPGDQRRTGVAISVIEIGDNLTAG